MKKNLFALTFLLFPIFLFAQNLVKDFSFENSDSIAIEYRWYNPTKASPDYFGGKGGMAASRQYPKTGVAYIGIAMCFLNSEYVQTRLTKSLTKNAGYCIKLYASLYGWYKYSADGIGAAMTRSRVHRNDKKMIEIDQQNTITLRNGSYITNTDGWTEICGWYVAHGGEKYLTIGNFSPELILLNILTRSLWSASPTLNTDICPVYFIDDVSVIPVSDSTQCTCVPLPDSAMSEMDTLSRANHSVVLKNVFFDTDSAQLLPTSFPTLNTLVDSLLKNEALTIDVYGHTDSTGNEARNQTLSEQRAQAVAMYLEAHGVSAERIKFFGMGSTMPLSSNNTPEGRQQNRRVEVRFTEKQQDKTK